MFNLVILPGLDGTGTRIAEFIRALQPAVDARIIVYPRDLPLGYDELETLVRAALPTDRRFVLLAESFSGPLAIRIAADPPLRLAAVILCGTFARTPFPWLRPARRLAVWLPIKALPRWMRAPLMWGSGCAPPRAARAMTGVADAVVRRRIGEVLSVDETQRLASIELPMLILTARRDRIVPRRATRRLLQGAPAAHVMEIDGPHLLLQSRPRECAIRVLRFLRHWN
jgi:pimeloyl-[acyl-carrier protein] methyl ester esterase